MQEKRRLIDDLKTHFQQNKSQLIDAMQASGPSTRNMGSLLLKL